jgi:glycerophosphoryl diester phosphodiesterase
MQTVALIDGSTTAVKSADGSYPWLNNIKLDAAPLNGDWVRAAALTKASVLSPVHGTPSSATPNTPGYVPFVTKEVVDRAHKLGMDVIPWTVDYEVTIRKLIGDGVDAIISDYPERVMWIAREMGYEVGTKPSKSKAQCLAKA